MGLAARRKTGFTLIETLVVVALSAVIGVSLLSSFYMGLRVWKTAASPRYNYRKALLGMERLAMELRSSLLYPGIGFFGNRTSCAFANIAHDKIFNVTYFYEPDNKTLERQRVLKQAVPGEEEPPAPRPVITYLEDFSFSFYGLNSSTGNFSFLDEWNSTRSGLPRAVKASVVLEGAREIEKIIVIPVAQ